ncbi:MAG: LLM class flavin-dependent oxidoreductase, partial [Acidimicrobiales bacterium]
MTMKLSILDQSPISQGATAAEALANTVELAIAAERLGYSRFWVAEHHNSDALAGSSPEILIGHIAANTQSIRVGSAGVMLTHYSPLKVAENFRLLEALHPGRIDLGLGRAPGSDHLTAAALARGGRSLGIEYYPSLVTEVQHYLHDEPSPNSGFEGVRARPATPAIPEMWLLASSQDSAAIAAHLGFPLGWAHFINPSGADITAAYRQQYQASTDYPEPHLAIATAVVCADTTEEAEALASSVRMWRARGLSGPIPPPDTDDSSQSALAVAPAYQQRKPLLAGTPDQVKAG